MNYTFLRVLTLCLFTALAVAVCAQRSPVLDKSETAVEEVRISTTDAPNPARALGNVSHLVRFSGVLNAAARQGSRLYGITFTLYADKSGGPALWMETQNVSVDQQGHYSVLLGANSLDGAPTGLFTTSEARWLGIQVEGAAEGERFALGSMPYAITAGNAERLAGQPAADYVRTATLREELRHALLDLNSELKDEQPASVNAQARLPGIQPAPPAGKTADPPLHGNEAVLAKLDQVIAILNQPKPPEPIFSFQLCTEPAFQGELEGGTQIKLDGTIEGRVGAEGYGNGAMIRLLGTPASKVEGKLKGAWDILKLGICWDIGATVRNRQAASAAAAMPLQQARLFAATQPQALALVDAVAGLDQEVLQAKLQALADTLQFNAANTVNALDSLGSLSLDTGPFAALREDGVFVDLAKNLPLPPNVRSVLQKPGDLLNVLQQIRSQGICNIDLPPAISGAIGQVCALIAGERFSKLLDRVDNISGNINANVNAVREKVENVLDRLPVAGDCKFFCN